MLVGLVGALDEEVALLLEKMAVEETKAHAGIRFYVGRLLGKRVVVCKAGVGKVNGALATQSLIDLFPVGWIIFTGTAGSLRPEMKILDVAISAELQQYDVDFSGIGFPPGVIPFQDTSIFHADPGLVSLAKKAARSVRVRAFTGRVLSGDQFVATQQQAERLRDVFGGLCVEAEGAAVGQVCFSNRIPVVVIRGISDQAGGADFARFFIPAARRAQTVVLAMLKRLRANDGRR